MAYMTFEQQVESHLAFLRSKGLELEELKSNIGFVRSRAIGETTGRGELCYKTTQSILSNGMLRLATWCISSGGVQDKHVTYGHNPFSSGLSYSSLETVICTNTNLRRKELLYMEAARKAEAFWRMSSIDGYSEYLRTKGVGCYGIRFRNNKYGKVGVVPMRDASGKLWNYQLLNPNGAKRFSKNGRVKGAFHILGEPINEHPIGLAESYVTAATCAELTGFSVVTAFSAHNLESVAIELRRMFPRSPIIAFADDDRHGESNTGLSEAMAVKKRIGSNCAIAIPHFDGLPSSKDFTDWNDLLREKGPETTRKILFEQLGILKNYAP